MTKRACICSVETKWLAACAALAIGEYCGFKCQSVHAMWPIAALAALLCVLFGFGFSLRAWEYAAMAFLGLALAMLHTARLHAVIEDALINSGGKPYSAVFTLRDNARLRHSRKGKASVEFNGEIRGLRVKVLANLPPDAAVPQAGETWVCTGWLSNRDSSDALCRRELWVMGERASMQRLDRDDARFSWPRFLCALREDAERRLRIGLENDETTSNLLCAMLLGKKHLMDSRSRQDFIASGAMHVFAISGLHVMVLAKVFVLMSVLTLMPLRFAGVIAIPLIWLYVAMVGAPPSAVRAATMSSICLVAPMFWHRPDNIVAWAMSFLGTHLLNPLQIIDVGSGFSFVVMLALVILLRLGENLAKRPLAGSIAFSCVAWAAGTPISAHVFGRISPGGLLSGPLAIPAATCVTVFGSLGIMASFISERLAAYINACAGITMRLMAAMAMFIARIPYATIDIGGWSLMECFAWHLAMAALFWLVLSVHNRRATTI